jgi:hypothetical protein
MGTSSAAGATASGAFMLGSDRLKWVGRAFSEGWAPGIDEIAPDFRSSLQFSERFEKKKNCHSDPGGRFEKTILFFYLRGCLFSLLPASTTHHAIFATS